MGKLPSNWEFPAIQSIAETIFGQSPPSSSYNTEGDGLPFFQGKTEFGEKHPIAKKWCTEPTREAQPGDILISVRAPVGPTNVADRHCAIGRGLAAIRPLIEPSYVRYWLKLSEQALAAKGTGTTFSAITKSVLNSHCVPCAPLNEQHRIVEKIETLFARLDKGEEALRAVQKLLGRYRQSVLKAAVTGHFNIDGNVSWEDVLLGDLLEDIRYGTAKKCRPDADGVAVLRIPNVVRGEIDLNDLKFTQLEEREIENLSLREGDLLIVRSNGSANLVGRGAVVNEEAVGLAFAGYLIRVRVNKERLLPDFLSLVLASPETRAKIERQARSTSGVHNINIQANIIECVDEHMSKLDVLEAWCQTELTRSANLRQSILKDAFAGRLVPQDPNDEPAAELLARIKNGSK